ncbi:HK97 family phage prohead protease [Clostridioides difficile]
MINLEIRNNTLHLEGYVNVTNRDSKPLSGKDGRFIEQIREGAFRRALQRRSDIKALINHDWTKTVGDLGKNLTLKEDPVGLRFKLETDNQELIRLARAGKLQGCSFGFRALKETTEKVNGVVKRFIEDLDLFEISLLDREPAYSGCVIEARAENEEPIEIREVELDLEDILKQAKELLENSNEIDETKVEEPTKEIEKLNNEEPAEDDSVKEVDTTLDYYKAWSYLESI